MKHSLIFKLQAVFNALWAIQLLFLPALVLEQYDWTRTDELTACMQACGTAMMAMAIFSFGMPSWASGGQLKKASLWFGVVAGLFLLLQIYQMFISHASPGGPMDIVSTVITGLFMVAFFVKSK